MCASCIVILLIGLCAVFYLPICWLIALIIAVATYKSTPTTVIDMAPVVYPPVRKVTEDEIFAAAMASIRRSNEQWNEQPITHGPIGIGDYSVQGALKHFLLQK